MEKMKSEKKRIDLTGLQNVKRFNVKLDDLISCLMHFKEVFSHLFSAKKIVYSAKDYNDGDGGNHFTFETQIHIVIEKQ